jgi:hypothetical protein
MQSRSFRAPLAILAIGIAFICSTLARTEGRPPPERMQATSYPYPIGTAATAAPGTAGRTATTVTRTPTPRGSATRTPTGAATSAPTERAQIQQPTIPATPTPSATVELSGDVLCVPGTQITVSGAGPRRAPILLYFDQRIVGGGSVKSDGRFSLPLTIGVERPGDHTVSVRVRGSNELLTTLTCSVPEVTPTPLPGRRPIP